MAVSSWYTNSAAGDRLLSSHAPSDAIANLETKESRNFIATEILSQRREHSDQFFEVAVRSMYCSPLPTGPFVPTASVR